MSSHPFRIIEQSRIKPIFALPIASVFAALGVWMIRDPDGSSRYSPAFITIMGVATVAMSAWLVFRGLSILLKPMRLVLRREGFQVENGDGRGLIGWHEITPFELVRVRGVRLVRYQILSERSLIAELSDRFLPGNLAISAADLFEIMESNRRIHGRAPRS
jgi:hypothetical protein